MAGATHEAFLQVLPKALGLSIGGRLAWPAGRTRQCRGFLRIGLLHLDEVAVGMGHRAIA